MLDIPLLDCTRRPRALIVVGALLALLATTPVYAATTILVFGDSLSAAYGIARNAGWVALLDKRLATADAETTVINASVSGDTTAGGRARLPAVLKKHAPDIVILELGGNDGLRALPVAEMKTNLAAMIESSQTAGAQVLLLGMRIPSNYGPRYSKDFHAVYDDLARRFDVAYVSFFLAPVAMDRSNFQADGIHPNADAQTLLLQHLWPALSPLLDRKIPASP